MIEDMKGIVKRGPEINSDHFVPEAKQAYKIRTQVE